MAKIENVLLKVEYDAKNEDVITVQIDYDIEFSDLDRLANVTYHETCRLVGVDTAGSGDVGNGGDDILLPPSSLVDQETATNGQFVVRRRVRKSMTRKKANEDPSPLQPRDELRAEVLMTDVNNQVEDAEGVSHILADRF